MIDIDEINERSKDDKAIIVGSEVRELVQMIHAANEEIERLKKQLEPQKCPECGGIEPYHNYMECEGRDGR